MHQTFSNGSMPESGIVCRVYRKFQGPPQCGLFFLCRRFRGLQSDQCGGHRICLEYSTFIGWESIVYLRYCSKRGMGICKDYLMRLIQFVPESRSFLTYFGIFRLIFPGIVRSRSWVIFHWRLSCYWDPGSILPVNYGLSRCGGFGMDCMF